MMGALFYYLRHSLQNRLVSRIRRLQQPKYLAGAIVGGFYFYSYIFRAFRHGRTPMLASPENQEMAKSLGALALLIMAALGWILPSSRAALSFTEAEVAFLFPAPIGRKTLIHFKLLRSQITILFSAFFMTIIGRSWGTGNFGIRLVGWWVAFAALNLHLMGASFVLTRLMDRGLSNWLRRIIFLATAGVVAGGALLWAYYAAPRPPDLATMKDIHWISSYATQVLHSGPLPYLLYPFRMVVAPYFAANLQQFIVALGPALGILALHYWWVIRSDVAFEEASVELSQKTADRVAAVRAGHWSGRMTPKKAKRPPFLLLPAGYPAVALLWKNLISVGSFVTTRFWLLLVWIAVVG
ncbi:MAG TPA: putative ABC exporter domain-containing protein, partial [Candidatus Saccharimonadales bacterium]|nr:putative ABC exporter domain-containing protein [Candidatus Saccharimonadales bacterium]